MEKINILKLLNETNDNFNYKIEEIENITTLNNNDIDNTFYIVSCYNNNKNNILNRFLDVIDIYYNINNINYLVFKNLTDIEIERLMRTMKYYYMKKENINLKYNIYKITCYNKKTKKKSHEV